MNKIAEIKQIRCGSEEFDFSVLFRACETGIRKLPVNVLMFEHRRQGLTLVNTGCSLRIKKNPAAYVKIFGERKLDFTEKDSISRRLKDLSLDPLAVRKVLLTHCDPECCGGLPGLPKYELYSTARVLAVLTIADPADNIMKSTLPGDNIVKKAAGLYNGRSFIGDHFKFVFDVFGDGSVLAVDLGGHANAMAGLFFPEHDLFYAADACIDETVIDQCLVPSDKLLSRQNDPDEYIAVTAALRRLHREHPEVRLRFLHSENI